MIKKIGIVLFLAIAIVGFTCSSVNAFHPSINIQPMNVKVNSTIVAYDAGDNTTMIETIGYHKHMVYAPYYAVLPLFGHFVNEGIIKDLKIIKKDGFNGLQVTVAAEAGFTEESDFKVWYDDNQAAIVFNWMVLPNF
jgi:hypothetical protein